LQCSFSVQKCSNYADLTIELKGYRKKTGSTTNEVRVRTLIAMNAIHERQLAAISV